MARKFLDDRLEPRKFMYWSLRFGMMNETQESFEDPNEETDLVIEPKFGKPERETDNPGSVGTDIPNQPSLEI